jgi:hypothetical protein
MTINKKYFAIAGSAPTDAEVAAAAQAAAGEAAVVEQAAADEAATLAAKNKKTGPSERRVY